MKRIFIIFITLLSLPYIVHATGIEYYKYNDVVMIHTDNPEFENAVLVAGEFTENRLENVIIYQIQSKGGKFQSERIKLAKDKDFKFYILKDLKSIMPLCSSLTLNLSVPDGSGNSIDGEYTKPY